jgi:hypothetical protein
LFAFHCDGFRLRIKFVAGLPVRVAAHGAILYVQLGKRRTPASRTKMPDFPVGKNYFAFLRFCACITQQIATMFTPMNRKPRKLVVAVELTPDAWKKLAEVSERDFISRTAYARRVLMIHLLEQKNVP